MKVLEKQLELKLFWLKPFWLKAQGSLCSRFSLLLATMGKTPAEKRAAKAAAKTVSKVEVTNVDTGSEASSCAAR